MRYRIENQKDFDQAFVALEDGDVIDGEGSTIEMKYTKMRSNVKFRMENINFSKIRKKTSTSFATFEIYGGLELVNVTFYAKNEEGYGNVCFIKADDASYFNAHNCNFFEPNHSGIQLSKCSYATISDSVFHLDTPVGYGYGIWQGGAGSAAKNVLLVKDCMFHKCRHAIGGSYHFNHINVQDSVFSMCSKHILDRHSGSYTSSGDFGVGGGDYIVSGCHFIDSDRHALNVPIPLDSGKIIIKDNIFHRASGEAMTFEVNIDGEKKYLSEIDDYIINHPKIHIRDNTYAPYIEKEVLKEQ